MNKKRVDYIRKLSYGLSSGTNEVINLSEETLLEGGFPISPSSDPDYNNSIHDDLKESKDTEFVVMPNKQNRLDEIKRIIQKASLDIQLIKEAQTAIVSLSKDFGARAAINIVANIPSASWAGNTHSPFNAGIDDKDVFDAIKSLYEANLSATPYSQTAFQTTDDLRKYIANVKIGGKFEIKNMDRKHAIMYAFVQCEKDLFNDFESKNSSLFHPTDKAHLFEAKAGNPIFDEIVAGPGPLKARLENVEKSITTTATSIHPLAILVYLMTNSGTKFLGGIHVISRAFTKLQSVMPSLTPGKAIIGFLGFKSLAEAYEYAVREDIPSNSQEYYVASTGSVLAEMGGAIDSLVENVMANISNLGAMAGKILRKFMDGTSEGYYRAKKMFLDSDNTIDPNKVHLLGFSSKNLIDVSGSFAIKEDDETFFIYTDVAKLKDAAVGSSKIYEDIAAGDQRLLFEMKNQNDIKKEVIKCLGGMYRSFNLDSKEVTFDGVSAGTVSFSVSQPPEAYSRFSDPQVSTDYGNPTKLAPILKRKVHDFGDKTTSNRDNETYYIMENYFSINQIGFENDQRFFLYDSSGKYTGCYQRLSENKGYTIFVKDEDGSFFGLPSVTSDNPSAEVKIMVDLILGKHNASTADSGWKDVVYNEIESTVNEANKSGVYLYKDFRGVNCATVFYYLKKYDQDNGLIDKAKIKKRKLRFRRQAGRMFGKNN